MSKWIRLIIFCCMCGVQLKNVVPNCPEICKCDMYEHLRRVVCSRQNLIMVNSDIPIEVEFLDLSFNKIKELEANIFQEMNLMSLKVLNVSHNKIGQIHLGAFEGLTALKTLDLGFNVIQYILPNWFSSLLNLEELFLRGNNFPTLYSSFPSSTLKVLDLSYCKIIDLAQDAFSQMPNLSKLILSGNYLLKLDFNTIKPLRSLQLLDLANNTFKCSTERTSKLHKYCTARNIEFHDPCTRIPPKQPEKFQKMISLVADNETNSWVFEEKTNNTVQTCSNHSDKSILLRVLELYPMLFLLLTFSLGVIVGLVVGCTPNMLSHGKSRRKIVRKQNTSKRNFRTTISRASCDLTTPLFVDLQRLGESTPVAQRKV